MDERPQKIVCDMKEDFLIESNHQIENAENVVNDTGDIIETTISDQHTYSEGLEIDVQESSYSSTVSEEDTLENVNSEVSLSTYEIIDDNTEICGVSLKGRQHTEDNEVCQDFHFFKDLGNGWHLYVVSDGAGSAKASHRGSKTNCEIASYFVKRMLDTNKWNEINYMPSEAEWYREFDSICRALKNFIEEKAESLDERLVAKDFNATLMLLLVTPNGMLSGHIGDGRMGYQNSNGDWFSIMTPHKGDEPNQTIFVLNAWDKVRVPAFRMSGVSVPEVRVIKDIPTAVVLITDGCENFCWNCVHLNIDTQRYEDRNTPFVGFLEPLIDTLNDTIRSEWMYTFDKSDTNREHRVLSEFIKFIDSKTEACRQEQDDRTMLLGLYRNNKISMNVKSSDIPAEQECVDYEV